MSRLNPILIFAAMCLCACLCGEVALIRQASAETPGRMCAILIGVDEYYRTDDLHFAGRDVSELKSALETFGKCDRFHVMDQTQEPADHPDFAKILWTLDHELKRVNEAGYETLLIFFAGHGRLDEDSGETYLVPGDYIPGRLSQTAISVEFVRQRLSACDRVKHKFLILDACHSGAALSADRQATVSEIVGKLSGAADWITLASCGADETSLEWSDIRHGLFTYWLCIGMSGWADRWQGATAHNGVVEMVELHRFVTEMVEATLAIINQRAQTQHVQRPKLIMREGTADAALVQLKSRDEQAVERDVKEHLEDARFWIKQQSPRYALNELDAAHQLKPYDPEVLAWRGKAQYHQYQKTAERSDWKAARALLDTSILLTEYAIRHKQGDLDVLAADLKTRQELREAMQ